PRICTSYMHLVYAPRICTSYMHLVYAPRICTSYMHLVYAPRIRASHSQVSQTATAATPGVQDTPTIRAHCITDSSRGVLHTNTQVAYSRSPRYTHYTSIDSRPSYFRSRASHSQVAQTAIAGSKRADTPTIRAHPVRGCAAVVHRQWHQVSCYTSRQPRQRYTPPSIRGDSRAKVLHRRGHPSCYYGQGTPAAKNTRPPHHRCIHAIQWRGQKNGSMFSRAIARRSTGHAACRLNCGVLAGSGARRQLWPFLN
ncbi:hypothetical protein NEFER02_2240, partial [Nematocida sp. LUAm2]